MSVEDAKTVDFISTDADGYVVLTVSDHLEWDDDNRHLLALQEKLNAYLRFVESGELYQSYPDARGRKIRIRLVALHSPHLPESRDFLLRARDTLWSAGFDFLVSLAR